MAELFRNSLFGFNREDVTKYVLKLKEKINISNSEIKKLNDSNLLLEQKLCNLMQDYNNISDKLAIVEEQLKDYEEREQALTRLSESIGRLYLVSQANAKTVMASAVESAEKSYEIVEKNIEIANEAEKKLDDISKLLNDKANSFILEINDLKDKISDTKAVVDINRATVKQKNSEVNELLEIVKSGNNK